MDLVITILGPFLKKRRKKSLPNSEDEDYLRFPSWRLHIIEEEIRVVDKNSEFP